MSLALSLRRARAFDSTLRARGLAARLARFGMVVLGGLIILAGVLIAPLPGPMGLPVAAVGLMIILRNSYKARRGFIRFQRDF